MANFSDYPLRPKIPNLGTSSIPAVVATTSMKSPLDNSFIKNMSSIISKKPLLISKADLIGLGKNKKLVGYNPLQDLVSDAGKSFSPRIINWVEPYEINGIDKSLFYTEVNSGLKVGDRVFILNGNYDSDSLIISNKYKKGRDGYKVLFVDNCQIVLDIDYTGVLPYLEESIDKFIKVYYIKNVQDFLHANRHATTGSAEFDYKFNYYQNNIAFIDQDYTTTTSWGRNGGIIGSPGFFVKSGITQSWTNISNDLINSGSYSYALSPIYSNNDRIKIMESDFTYNGKTFQEGFVYKWNVGPTQSEWIVDVKYSKPLITKGNFRDGNFNGFWNTGLFGSQNKQIKWEGKTSTWKSGTLLNTNWIKGTYEALYTLPESYYSGLNDDGFPYQKLNTPNNSGRSFNFIIDSIIEQSTINNGTIINSIIGTSSATYSVVENYLMNYTTPYPNLIKKAYFEDCNFNNAYISNSELKNIKTNNSKFENVKSVNSYFRNSVFINSNYNSDNIIKILGYDELNATEYPSIGSTFSIGGSYASLNDVSQKVYKFYINESGYNRLKTGDKLYIKGIKLNNSSKEILNLFDKKLRLGSWTEYIDDYNIYTNKFFKRGIDVSAFLSSPLENSYLFESVRKPIDPLNTTSPDTYHTSVYSANPNSNLYSIDIWMSIYDINDEVLLPSSPGLNGMTSPTPNRPFLKEYLNINTSWEYPTKYDYISATGSGPVKLGNIVDVTNAYIVDADFESGIFENSNWNSGYHINSQTDLNITDSSATSSLNDGVYNLSFTSSNSLLATSLYNQFHQETEYPLFVGEVVFLDGVDFNDGTTITRLPDAYKVVSNNLLGVYKLEELVTGTVSIISSLTQSTGTFSTTNAGNRYGYIKSLKFNKSKIKSGIFRRPYITNSIIENDSYDSLDKDFSDIPKLRNLVVTDSLFTNKSNRLSSATYLYSSFLSGSDSWNNGIIQNSIWVNGTFSSGVIKESSWLDGVFTGGQFYGSRSFNDNATSDYQYYDTNRIRTYYKNGYTYGSPYTVVVGTTSNDRYSWRGGVFLNGLFSKSDWESGTFSGGQFFNSKWYDGIFENGTLGSNQLSTSDTIFYNGTFSYVTVENALIYASDTSHSGMSSSTIVWKNGVFNNGIFSTDYQQSALNSTSNTATWENGLFNGGQFVSMAKWKSGTFNNGKFTSAYGWSQSSSTLQSDYSWESGKFNGGEFGNANGLSNSTWYTGEFNNGVFKGRVWNDGIFLYGEFQGSGDSPVSGLTCGNASDFVNAYTYSYWGHWRNGIFTDVKDKFITDIKLYTKIKKSMDVETRGARAKFKNALWESGTFSHPSGEMFSSVWLDGSFESGKFKSSSFNPYVKRGGSLQPSFNLNDDTCYWENGQLEDSDFYISRWKNGTFTIGTATGMIWENGVNNYMNAFNVFWEAGTWKNGNWYGSSFQFDGEVDDDYTMQILMRGMYWSGTSSCHVWNIFLDNEYEPSVMSFTASTPVLSPRNLGPQDQSPLPIDTNPVE
jgi:hypothetical protein